MKRQLSSRWRSVALLLMSLLLALPVRTEKTAPREPAHVFLRHQLVLAGVLVLLCTLGIVGWLGWMRSDVTHGSLSALGVVLPDPGNTDFLASALKVFTGDSYELRYRSDDQHLKLGDIVRLWGESTVQQCAEATIITWDDRGIRALLALPDSPVIGLDAPISLVSLSPDHTPEWVTKVGRCRTVHIVW
ncbi:MAG: hypothetical protein IT320_00710 [Anaerolineae bacterium]|nr:hypothetical protein [Anaerolineae bacterium]